jgi:hypothetical protein
MKTYTKEQFLKAAELGEVSMIDAKHIVSLLDEVVNNENGGNTCRDCKTFRGTTIEFQNDGICSFSEYHYAKNANELLVIISKRKRNNEWKPPYKRI